MGFKYRCRNGRAESVYEASSWRIVFLCALSGLTLASCSSAAAPSAAAKTASASQKEEAAKAPAKPSVETVKPIPTPMETFRALAPQEGLKLTPLFTGSGLGEEARILRLETAVQQLRDDFDTIMPTMVRMAAMENSIRELIDQLRSLQNNGLSPATVSPDFVGPVQPKPEPPDKLAPYSEGVEGLPPPPEKFGPLEPERQPGMVFIEPQAGEPKTISEIKSIRIGSHPDHTRIVLDATAGTSFTARMDSGNSRLIISLPETTAWTGKLSESFSGNGLVSGYRFENGNVVIGLRHGAKIIRQETLPPENGANTRLIIDIAA